ncbi:MAG: multidrug transporter [Herpetosiphonaceae bacterium]|nr:multidrug transporter [Herpetosiphonaceae bacterium]
MKRLVLRDPALIAPFGEPARDLRILNKPLWLLQRDVLAHHCQSTLEFDTFEELFAQSQLELQDEELLVYKDNLFFDAPLIDSFIREARQTGRPCQLAFAHTDKAITAHALRLQQGLTRQNDVYVAALYYFPRGPVRDPAPLLMATEPREMGYYRIPSYMAPHHGDLVYQVPRRACLSIEHWTHLIYANSIFGVFAWARRKEQEVEDSWRAKLRVSAKAFLERKHFLGCSELVKIGKNCSIDPTAIIQGPTVIGNNVHIGAGVVIVSSLIGSNVTIMQGSQIMLSVISDRCYLPFNASLFMTTLMENTMVAQLTCLQLCVVGRNTFIGAGVIFTDFDLLGEPIHALWNGTLHDVGTPVMGSAVGHNVKIGSGFVVYPARMIESGTVLCYGDDHAVIPKNVPAGTYTRPPVFYPDRDPRVQLTGRLDEPEAI